MGKDKIVLAICFCLIVALAGFSALLYLGAKGLESKVSDLETIASNLEAQNAELNEKVQNYACTIYNFISSYLYDYPGTTVHFTSFNVPKGEEVTKYLSLAVDDHVLVKFTVVGYSRSTIDFYITDPDGDVKVEYNKVGCVSYPFVCDETGEYVLHFSNTDLSEDKLVTLNYEVEHETTIRVQEESLFLTKQHVWFNTSGSWAQAAIVIINTGGKDVVLDKIAVRGQESPWGDVYYWRTSNVTISDDLEVTSTNITGANFNITVQGATRTFQQASADLTLKSGWTMVVYVMNPDSVALNDVGITVGITLFTSNAQYYKETNIEAVSFMGTEELAISKLAWKGPNTSFELTIANTGTEDVTITQIQVNYGTTGVTQPTGLPLPLKAADTATLTVTFAYVNGTSYDISVVTSSGYKFTDHFIGGQDKV
jgi:hypothetical protein